ncbi:MAG: hypothetical protein KDC28_02745 [Saprospiraceae bacterium]|nr:hypothetical protein [Saprospiraceae bacterium]MCB9319335.1 hypothetical protein [Lewinellaceae bacterium]
MSEQKFFKWLLIFWAGILPCTGQQPPSTLVQSFEAYQKMKSESPYRLDWVSIGPMVNSARADVVMVDPSAPGTMYVGYGSGGLWKTTNNGLDWHPVFENQAALGIGDAALAPSNPDIIYVGTGEHLKKPRNFTLPGTGMYRSDDAGKTWEYIGLEDSWSIAEIAVHPTNPDIVLVCVLGHLWTPNRHRGVYRTINGGRTWEHVLYVNDRTGANDVVISPTDPDRIYASLWEVYPGISGTGSGIYTSKDGGSTWSRCVNGIPVNEHIGRIGLAVSQQNPDKVYAFMDNLNNPRDDAAELYRSTDGGEHWQRTHEQPFKLFPGIGWYFTDVYVNPQNDDDVYCLGVRLARSQDGGKTFSFLGGHIQHMNPSAAQGLHLDQCELWINPENPSHLALGNDGGFYVSYDAGESWTHFNNLPVGEFYDLTIDQKRSVIYGGTQDDATVYGPPQEIKTHFPDPWKYIWIDPWDGGDGCISQVDPKDSCIVYYSQQHGEAIRYDRCADSTKRIKPSLPESIQDTLNFNYITPYFISPHQANTLYHGGNYVFKSLDRGNSWQVISGNLAKSINTAKRSFALGALVESPVHPGWLYAGTDKGGFWFTQDDGLTWTERSAGLANRYIRSICPSRFETNRVYLAMTGINDDDLDCYLYRSEDLGTHWLPISDGLPREPVNVLLEDPHYPDLLYAGTARGVFISQDRGEHWDLFGQNMPSTAVADLEILDKTSELIAATHGRGMYKLGLSPIYEMLEHKLDPAKNWLFPIAPTPRPWFNALGGEVDQRTTLKLDISFWLLAAQPVTLEAVDDKDQTVWEKKLEGSHGFNQYRWDLVMREVTSNLPYFIHYREYLGAGKYRMILVQGNQVIGEQPFTITKPESPYRTRD